MDAKISKHAKDLIQKYTSGLFRNASLAFYGIKSARVKEIISVELPAVAVSGSSADFVFLLEDDSYLHFEFQTTYNKKDLARFAGYDVRLYERDERQITTVVIYAANVKYTDDSITIGSLIYQPQKVMMNSYDGDAIYAGLSEKISAGQDITDADMLNLIFLPLMRHTVENGELAAKSVHLAKRIPDTAKRNACIAAAFAFGSKYLNVNGIEKLREALRMTDLANMFFNEGEAKKSVEIAKRLFKNGLSVQAIAEATDLDEATVRALQTELSEAV